MLYMCLYEYALEWGVVLGVKKKNSITCIIASNTIMFMPEMLCLLL